MCSPDKPANCFLPPYLIREIAENGTPAQQEHARQNMASSWQIRSFPRRNHRR